MKHLLGQLTGACGVELALQNERIFDDHGKLNRLIQPTLGFQSDEDGLAAC